MNGNMKILVFLILFVVLISLACGSVRSVFPTPIYSPRPTNTQSSVDAPRPTIIPGVLVCSNIVTAHEGMTSSQTSPDQPNRAVDILHATDTTE